MILQRRDVPIMQNVVYPTERQARNVQRGEIHLTLCSSCGFCYNRAFQSELVAYDESYDNLVDGSSSFEQHLSERTGVVAATLEHGGTVLEIGCGRGLFLDHLITTSPKIQGIGIDPSHRGPMTKGSRLRFEHRFFGGLHETLVADALVCRHVIEHLPDPLAFLREIRLGLEGSQHARIFFETPSFEWILERQAIWDIFYEHCNYFTAPVLKQLFAQAGLPVTRIEPIFHGQHFWIEATVGLSSQGQTGKEQADITNLSEASYAFGQNEGEIFRIVSKQIEQAQRRGAVALWGAAAKGTTLANLLDPKGTTLATLIDINTGKQGKYLAGTGHRISAPAALTQLQIATTIVTNPAYLEEVTTLVHKLGANTVVEVLHHERNRSEAL